jgi:hypothetical protein
MIVLPKNSTKAEKAENYSWFFQVQARLAMKHHFRRDFAPEADCMEMSARAHYAAPADRPAE